MRLLVLGAGGNAANNFIRSVKDRHYVIGADPDELMLGLSEAHQVHHFHWEDRLEEVQALVSEYNVDAIWAQPQPEVAWLAHHREYVGARCFLPSQEIIWTCNDKLDCARRVDALAPRSAEVSELDDYLTRYGEAWLRLRVGAGSAGALPVTNPGLAWAWLDHYYDSQGISYGDWMISKRLRGRDLSWTGIYADGHLVISVAKERLSLLGAASSPAGTSSTAKAQIIAERPDVNNVAERAIELVAGPEAHGVFMVDLREDNGHPKVTEINAGRFGTTVDMYQSCGPNMAEIAVQLMGDTYNGDYGRRDEHEIGALWLRNTDCVGRRAE